MGLILSAWFTASPHTSSTPHFALQNDRPEVHHVIALACHAVQLAMTIRAHSREVFDARPDLLAQLTEWNAMMSFSEFSTNLSINVREHKSAHETSIVVSKLTFCR
jgi:hypothetical protein